MRGKLVPATWVHDTADDYVPARYRRACRYESFVPELIGDWAPDLPGELAGVVADAEFEVAALERDANPSLAALSRLLLRTEAIASSKIEGMQVGTRELARAEARSQLGTRVGPEARSILSGIDAMQFAIDEAAQGDASVSSDALLQIHELLMANEATWTMPGRFRTEQNWIGGNNYNPCGADYVPPPPDEVPRLLEDLFVACANETAPTVVQCAIVHAQFETIHPFNDGNGRVGRALIHVLLRRRGLATTFVPPVSVVLSRRRDQYIEALTRFRADDVEDWIELFAVSLARAAELARGYLVDARHLQQNWRDQLAAHAPTPRADAAAWLLIEHLPALPIVTSPGAVAATGRSKPAVNQAIEQLVAAGILEPSSHGKRNRTWEPVGLLDLIEGIELDA